MGTINDRNGTDQTEQKILRRGGKNTQKNYTVEVINRFRRLDLIDKVPEELWMEVCDVVQKAVIKTIPKKKNAKRQNGCLRRPNT